MISALTTGTQELEMTWQFWTDSEPFDKCLIVVLVVSCAVSLYCIVRLIVALFSGG